MELRVHSGRFSFLLGSGLLADLRTHPPLDAISFMFMQFSGKNWPNNRLTPHLGGWRPPAHLGNSGSATDVIRNYVQTSVFEFFTIGVSVRLSDRSLHMEDQKNIRQKLPPVGIETRTSGSRRQCFTNWAKSTFSYQPESSWPL